MKALKVVMIVFPIVVLLGGTVLLGVTGIVKIPFLTPPAKKTAPKAKGKDSSPQADTTTPSAQDLATTKPQSETPTTKDDKKTDAPTEDPKLGTQKLAALWNEVETTQLVSVLEKWKDPDAATVLIVMDPDKVAEVLSKMKPDRAAKLSRELQKQASKLKA